MDHHKGQDICLQPCICQLVNSKLISTCMKHLVY
ncbi:hypothetical protein SLEP1_g52677 [Rubroshorea leprosula]|uniref:Uncharacterized protein n=1 Tax=Rubroshorea leprosula TaxID=152421 RepID=A0AAV5M7Y6_9ROSI|nr:hypothetical protein SLEP1_g52677 [Rubroshorea leprosula]